MDQAWAEANRDAYEMELYWWREEHKGCDVEPCEDCQAIEEVDAQFYTALVNEPVADVSEWCLECFRPYPTEQEISQGTTDGDDTWIEECRTCGGLRVEREEQYELSAEEEYRLEGSPLGPDCGWPF